MDSKQATSDKLDSNVLEQLTNKHVLITGTAGFLGKVVLIVCATTTKRRSRPLLRLAFIALPVK